MNVETLVQNEKNWKKLTENDRTRLRKLLVETEFSSTIQFMLL